MILGSISQPPLVEFLGQSAGLRRALDLLRELTPDCPEGITEIEGREFYLNVHGYETKPRQACRWESHRHTTDVQFCLDGGELIDWTTRQPSESSETYDEEKDFEVWPANEIAAETITLQPGHFAIFLPGELHRPMIADGVNERIRKAVVKINSRFLGLS